MNESISVDFRIRHISQSGKHCLLSVKLEQLGNRFPQFFAEAEIAPKQLPFLLKGVFLKIEPKSGYSSS